MDAILESLKKQILTLRTQPKPRILECPYCHSKIQEGEHFCCPRLHMAYSQLGPILDKVTNGTT